MKRLLKEFMYFKSMFWKLIASFIMVITIISSFHFAANLIYIRNMEYEITNNASEKFNNVVIEFEQCFDSIKNNLLMDFYIKNFQFLESPKFNNYNDVLMVADIKKYMVTQKYIQDFVVLIKDFNYVITKDGTYEKKIYFDQIYKNEYYPDKFWLDEIKKEDFMYKIYPFCEILAYDSGNGYIKQYTLPVAFKNIKNADLILIAFIDIQQLLKDLELNCVEDIYIYGNNRELIYPLKDSNSDENIRKIFNKGENIKYLKAEDGYIFINKSNRNPVLYCKIFPNTILKQQINETNRLLQIIILASIVISIMLSVYIVKKFNNPVKQLYQLIKQSKDVYSGNRDIIDLKNIKDGVVSIINKNASYVKDIDEKNSMLKSFFYQSTLRNISLVVEGYNENPFYSDNYAVILVKIHYRNYYKERVSADMSKVSNALKELIHAYSYQLFNDAITFQLEDTKTVSIVSIKDGAEAIEDNIGKNIHKFFIEDENIYFTVVCSRVSNNRSDLHETYEKVTEILKHRKFIQTTQFLKEDILKEKLDGFYFPKEQQEQFMNLLSNLKKDECLQMVDSIFDTNYKMEISEFCIYLLCVQLMDCCSNIMIQTYNKVPKKLPFINNYFNIEQYGSIEDYKNKNRSIVIECIDYISKNQRESDYIVDYVTSYISDNYINDINVNFLAEKLEITRTYLSWYFKNKTGINLSDYLNSYRMTKACVLLQNSILKIKDIAPEVGIYSISTFMRLFKQHIGMTPNDYRKCNLH